MTGARCIVILSEAKNLTRQQDPFTEFSPERAIEMLCGDYPERRSEILHFVQDDRRRAQHDSRRIQDDSEGLTMTGKGFAT